MMPIMALLILSLAGGVIAKNTVVAGVIWNSDNSAKVPLALVAVTCNSTLKNTTSLSDGTYAVNYVESEGCSDGTTATVTASKGSLSGSSSGTVHDFGLTVNLAIASVTLTPEFGIIAGVLTVFGALGIFMIVRRK